MLSIPSFPEISMRRVPVVLVFVLLASCGDRSEDQVSQQVQTTTQQVAQGTEDGFVLLRGTDTVAVERYTRSGDTLEGDLIDVEEGDRARYRAVLGPEALVSRLELEAYPSGATSPEERAVLTFEGDSVIAEWQENGSVRRDADVAPPGTVAYFSPSVALLEQTLRRARAVGGERVELPVLIISAQRDPRLERALVTWIGADSAHIVVDEDNQLRVAVDAEGRIIGGSNSPQNVRVERIR
jgi:hypothetical protein